MALETDRKCEIRLRNYLFLHLRLKKLKVSWQDALQTSVGFSGYQVEEGVEGEVRSLVY